MTVSHKPHSELEKEIGHSFANKDLLTTALTHSSTGTGISYERLEFLGDRVLGLIVSEILYEKFTEEPEGHLAKRLSSLVQGSWLAQMAQKIHLGAYMDFSDAERNAGGFANENILKTCRRFIEHLWGDAFYNMTRPPQHPKTALQEWAQGQGLPLPTYKIIGQSGPDHAPLFDVCLRVQGYDDLIAQGRSRQVAEREAATLFLQTLKKQN